MTWKAEFGTEYDVPGFLDFLAQKGVVNDMSWHNDISPSFGVYDDERDLEVRLWVDHQLASQRECGSAGKRFIAQIGPACTEADKNTESDDLETALHGLFGYLAEFHGKTGNWSEPDEYLHELTEEYRDSLSIARLSEQDSPERFVRDYYKWMEAYCDVNEETEAMVARAKTLIDKMK